MGTNFTVIVGVLIQPLSSKLAIFQKSRSLGQEWRRIGLPRKRQGVGKLPFGIFPSPCPRGSPVSVTLKDGPAAEASMRALKPKTLSGDVLTLPKGHATLLPKPAGLNPRAAEAYRQLK